MKTAKTNNSNKQAGNTSAAQHTNIIVQPKLTVGDANSTAEQEADATADTVMRMPEQNFIQRKCADCEKEEKLHRKPMIQAKAESSARVNSDNANTINASKGKGSSMEGNTQNFMSSRFGKNFSDIKIHTDNNAIQLSRELNAKAFTVGNDIYFNEGQYQPDSSAGKHLLAHELAHTMQQGDHNNTIQRQAVDMPAQTITSGMPSDVSSLSTPATGITMARDTATIERNSQLPETVLPFISAGWDGNDIANKLGQYDRIPGTDSDAVRCVQSVALMSHIIMGPQAAIGYLSSISLQGMLQAPQMNTRMRTAMQVIRFVRGQIEARRATYGNMYWAMEAVHDMFYADGKGTPAANANNIREQVTPMLDLSRSMVNVDVWCNNRAELLTQASSLNPGEQFLLNTWSVSFNHYFDIAGADPTAQTFTYTQTDENDRPLRTVNIRRINTAMGKPGANQIDTNRDNKSGHQMLIFKDAVNSHIKMYEPEITNNGNHLFDLTDDPSVIDSELFADQPRFEIFKYVQLWGKIVPAPASPFSQ